MDNGKTFVGKNGKWGLGEGGLGIKMRREEKMNIAGLHVMICSMKYGGKNMAMLSYFHFWLVAGSSPL